ncbi:MAG: hypothetical protein JWM85_3026, partial [Acidimicrobiaceae bacterium]|nr:hypothetical protein [Acidimicrobiaceae bacterium]
IATWLCERDPWGAQVIGALVEDLQNANSFTRARDAAERLQGFGKLPSAVLDAIERAYLTNDQLYPSHVGARLVAIILEAHGRRLPSDQSFQGPPRRQ